jgi:hypothetical protein
MTNHEAAFSTRETVPESRLGMNSVFRIKAPDHSAGKWLDVNWKWTIARRCLLFVSRNLGKLCGIGLRGRIWRSSANSESVREACTSVLFVLLISGTEKLLRTERLLVRIVHEPRRLLDYCCL